MKVEIESVRMDNASCNFCSRGRIDGTGRGLMYPYETVYTFCRDSGSGVKAAICDDCLKELAESAAVLKMLVTK